MAAGAIIRGMTRQVGNQIDEFVTTALRNNLLGLPLDLATINLARGRDTGVPSLNAARREFYEASNQDVLLKPYDSWTDFAGHLKNEASIINFIAAYGTHPLITGGDDPRRQARRRAHHHHRRLGGRHGGPGRSSGLPQRPHAYAGGTLGGLENVDLWIGGLAEATMPFGGSSVRPSTSSSKCRWSSSRTATGSTTCSASTACICSAKWRTTPSPR